MPVQNFFLILLVPIVLYEIVSVSSRILSEEIKMTYKTTTWFSYFVVIQLILLVYEDVFLQDAFHFSIWILLFLFYGPFLNLIVSTRVKGNQYVNVVYYFSDFYRMAYVFIFVSFLSLVMNQWGYIKECMLFVFSVTFFYYGVVLYKKMMKQSESFIDRKEQQSNWNRIMHICLGILLLVFFFFLSENLELSAFLLLLLFYVYLTFLRKKMESKPDLMTAKLEEAPHEKEEEWQHIQHRKEKDGQKSTQESTQESAQESTLLKYGQTKLNDVVLQRCNVKVYHIIIENKAYLDADFKMTDLASKTKISRYYLAQYFNVVYQMNFREYINKLRIEHVVEYIEYHQAKEKLSVHDLFLESAFHSKTSFFKSFKQVLGCTPFEYLKKSQ